MQESANSPWGRQVPINDIGDGFVRSFLERLKPDPQSTILAILADENLRYLCRLLAEHCDASFLALARLEGIGDTLLGHNRTQMMTLRSFLLALDHHGKLAASEEHPLQLQSESESTEKFSDE